MNDLYTRPEIVLINLFTLVAFPGIGLEEKITALVGVALLAVRLLAIRERAAIGSPGFLYT